MFGQALRAAAAVLCLSALADTAAANCARGPFSGLYIGGAIGVGVLSSDQTSPGDPNIGGDDTGFTGGVYTGYNMQCRNMVFGIETDFNFMTGDANSNWPGATTAATTFVKTEVDAFGSLRGRLGITVRDDMLLYATGGLAYADVSHDLSKASVNLSQSNSGWQTGWVAGAGIEFLRRERWLLRAEALYVDLGEKTHTYTVTTGCGAACTDTARYEDSFWVARVGLSVKLGHEERPVPLK